MKTAFSLIELIVAIVIISIVIVAIPSMIFSTSNLSHQAILQEAITSTKTLLSNVLTNYWNTNSINGAIIQTNDDSLGTYEYNGQILNALDINEDVKQAIRNGEFIDYARLKNYVPTIPITSSNSPNAINEFDDFTSTLTIKNKKNSKNIYNLEYKISVKNATIRVIDNNQNPINKAQIPNLENLIIELSDSPRAKMSNALSISIQTKIPTIKQELSLKAFAFNIGEPRLRPPFYLESSH